MRANVDKAKYLKWLHDNERKCPKCESTNLVPFKESVELHPNAATEKGIDTSYETNIVYIRCNKCGYDKMQLIPL